MTLHRRPLLLAAGAAALARPALAQAPWPNKPVRVFVGFPPGGSLDVMTQRELAATDARHLARDEVDYYRSCPGDRAWWRVACDRHGDVVGGRESDRQ